MKELKQVKSYSIFYRHLDHSGMIYLNMKDGSGQHFAFHSEQEASLILDLLRNEKPVFYDPVHEMLATGMEPVGEGETKTRKPRKRKAKAE